MRIFNDKGELKTYKSSDGDIMKAVSANFGTFGVIYDVTLKLDPQYIISTSTEYEPLKDVFRNKDFLRSLIEKNFSIELFWFPFNSYEFLRPYNIENDQIWIRKINYDDSDPPIKGKFYYTYRDAIDFLSQKGLQLSKPLYQIALLTPLLMKAAFKVLSCALYPQGVIHQQLVHGIHFRYVQYSFRKFVDLNRSVSRYSKILKHIYIY